MDFTSSLPGFWQAGIQNNHTDYMKIRPLFYHIFWKKGFYGSLQYGGQTVKLDIGNRSGAVFDSGYGTAADIDCHGFQLFGQLLLTEFSFFPEIADLATNQIAVLAVDNSGHILLYTSKMSCYRTKYMIY